MTTKDAMEALDKIHAHLLGRKIYEGITKDLHDIRTAILRLQEVDAKLLYDQQTHNMYINEWAKRTELEKQADALAGALERYKEFESRSPMISPVATQALTTYSAFKEKK